MNQRNRPYHNFKCKEQPTMEVTLFDKFEGYEIHTHVVREYRFTVLGRAQQRGSKQASLIPKRGGGWVEKNGRPIVVARDDNAKSKDWMQEVKHAAIAELSSIELITGAIELTAEFYFKRPGSHYGSGKNASTLKPSAPMIHAQSPDLAKLLRSLEDALSGVVWRDDKQVFRYGAGTQRYWTDSHERTVVTVREVAT
jgi:Holliday junction resolvase RusA-like endonuclease